MKRCCFFGPLEEVVTFPPHDIFLAHKNSHADDAIGVSGPRSSGGSGPRVKKEKNASCGSGPRVCSMVPGGDGEGKNTGGGQQKTRWGFLS